MDEMVDTNLGVGVLEEGGELFIEISSCQDISEHSGENNFQTLSYL